ncbi:MAG: terpene utilization protein AtuA, partial [Myxococcota bacterium]
FANAVMRRTEGMLQHLRLPSMTETSVEIFGDESHYGAAKKTNGAREVTLKLAAKHPTEQGIGVLLKETIGLGLSGPPGLTLFAGSRPRPSPVVRLFSFLLPKTAVSVRIDIDGEAIPSDHHLGHYLDDRPPITAEPPKRPAPPDAPAPQALNASVPLVRLAWGRSGDKGDKANIGIIARRPEYLPYIWAALTEAVVRDRFAHFIRGGVERFLMPGSSAINFLLHDILGGGGVASLRNDPQGKGYAQILLDHEIPVPTTLAEKL